MLGRLVELVEPAPDGDGLLDGAGNLVTTYAYDAIGLVARITQSRQERIFEYDSLGRLRRQALPEKARTLSAAGELVGAGGKWSDVFGYDDRSHLTWIVDARGVRTNYEYGDDPLGRLQELSYSLPPVRRLGRSARSAPRPDTDPDEIIVVGASHFAYKPTGDVTRIRSITTDGVGVQTYDYEPDSQRISSIALQLADWPGHTLEVGALYDRLGRLSHLYYPLQYGARPPRNQQDRRYVHQSYDSVGRPETTSMAIFPQRDMSDVASVLRYSAAGQVESSRAGPAGLAELIETYAFDPVTGLPSGQRVTRVNSQRLLDLSYDFMQVVSDIHAEPSRTGQLTAVTDNLHPERDLRYSCDQVGRLSSVAKGTVSAPGWTQTYDYDRYGNRTAVRATPPASRRSAVPLDGHAATPVDEGSNRLTIAGYRYDAAGNLIRSKEGGAWLRYRYDAAGRLAAVLTDRGTQLESYVYGFDRSRVLTRHTTGPIDRTIYVWAGGQVLSEFTRTRARLGQRQDVPRWSRDNIYQLGRLVAAVEPTQNGRGPDRVRYFHPDRIGIRLVTGPGAADKAEQVNLPFGVAAESSAGFNPRFTSYDRSRTTGLDYAINRFYSPIHGQFTQPDPIGLGPPNGGDPQALNLYAYGQNDPINTVDPSGLDCKLTVLPNGTFERELACVDEDGSTYPVELFAPEVVIYGRPLWGPQGGGGGGEAWSEFGPMLIDRGVRSSGAADGAGSSGAGTGSAVPPYSARQTPYPKDPSLLGFSPPAWAVGVEFDLSAIIPALSGGGGVGGFNVQYTSNTGLNVYSVLPTSTPSEGFSVGVSLQFNVAVGSADHAWSGIFRSVGGSAGLGGASVFGAVNERGLPTWLGFSGGGSFGLPGIYRTETNYIPWFGD